MAVLAASALICAPAAGEPPEWMPSEKALAKRLAKVGTWNFTASQPNPDSAPACRETWVFRTDGTGWVESGSERVTLTWRILSVIGPRPDRLLYTTALASEGGPDCAGTTPDPAAYPREERGFFVRFNRDGSAALCGTGGFQHSFDRTKKAPLAAGFDDCWGQIVPAAGS